MQESLPVGEPVLETPQAKPGEVVLLVEDEPSLRFLLRKLLVGAGYNVIEAKDGVEAIRVADQHPGSIHLVISDIIMPRMGGLELWKHLKDRRPPLKVLFASGYADKVPGSQGGTDPEMEFLEKPFAKDQLLRKVRATLDKPLVTVS